MNSNFINRNDIRYSYLKECSFQRDGENRIELTYIKSKPENIIFGDLKECIVRSGTVDINSKVDSKTEFIEKMAFGSEESEK